MYDLDELNNMKMGSGSIIDQNQLAANVNLPDLLTKKEKGHFIEHQGETAALAKKLCSIFGIPEKNIEVSKASNITVEGIIMYLVHFVNRDDVILDMHDVDIHDIKKLYKNNGKKINDAF